MKGFFSNIKSDSYNQLSKQDTNSLERELTEHKIIQSLRSMQHNKSPEIDRFPSEFDKIFWKKLKIFVL